MRLERGPVPIDVARELVEEALSVVSRSAAPEVRAEFCDELEAVQGIETVDIRERQFEVLDSHWMERLRVAETLESVLAHHPDLENLVSTCFLKLARGKDDEKAFLYDDGASVPGTVVKPALVLQLTVDTLLAVDKLEALLSATLPRARRL